MRSLVKHGVALALFAFGASTSPAARPASEPSRLVLRLTPNADNGSKSEFQRERQRTGTRLTHASAAPDLYKDPASREGVRLERYAADGHELKIWHVAPAHDQLWGKDGYPAVIFVHDGTSLSDEELAQAFVFTEAGFVVLAPTFRGENGNPGSHELLFGELDDLVAATAYATHLPDVDGRKLAIWGHGLGGMLASLVSLVPNLGVLYTGSSAGLRPPSTFEVVQKPFEDNERERSLRLFGPNLEHMQSPHWACVAKQDPAVDAEAVRLEAIARELQLPLSLERVDGSRSASREVCTRRTLTFLLETLGAAAGPSRPPR